MNDTLPFEYGFMYRPINNYQIKIDTWEPMSSTFSSPQSYMIRMPTSGWYGIATEYNINPIGYKQGEQKVVVELIINESKTSSMFLPNFNSSNINFSQIDVNEKFKRITRLDIDVNEFIKNFEKVL